MRRHLLRIGLLVLLAGPIAGIVGLGAPAGTAAATVSVAVKNFEFSPASETVTAGDTILWTFSGAPHSVTSTTGVFDSGIMSPDGTFEFRFTTPGTYHYFCVVHPGLMKGTVLVEAATLSTMPL